MVNQESTGFLVPPSAIVNQIRILLKERYKEGFPIIKEIIQNANDGGASCLDIGITRGLKEVVHPLLREPALFFVNNGSFKDSDAQAIGWFGADLNAGNVAKIGKFGLGQKSIFHFCEAFFYIAHSQELSNYPDRWRFLNPWANATNFEKPDAKRPDWQQLTQKDKEVIEVYLRDNDLLNQNYDAYFILWLPLRSPTVKDRCILTNTYNHQTIQDQLPKDMESRIATLMPMLRSLHTVNYWLSNEENELQVSFRVHLDNCSQRFTYPKDEEIFPSEIEDLLHGKVAINDYSMEYVGHEVILSPNPFELLLPISTKQNTNFWTALRGSEFWPKRSIQDEWGEPQSIPDKAIPHCGVIISRRPVQKTGGLTVQWAVFLPLSDDNSGSAEFEDISSNRDWDYTLLLHGYFFLDSGRRSIEALIDIYQGKVREETSKSDVQMMRLWNAILATEGTLLRILLALKEFCNRLDLAVEEVTKLCHLLSKTKLFQEEALQKFIYRQNCWIYRIHPNQAGWQLVDRTIPIMAIPSIPNWIAFPRLSDFAETHCLVLVHLPNLMPFGKPDTWQDSDVEAVLDTLITNQVFYEETQLEFLVKWLQSVTQPLADNVQTSLKTQIRETFSHFGYDKLSQRWVKDAVSLLHESHWFDFDCTNNDLLKILNQKTAGILVLPYTLAPQRQTPRKLTGKDAGVLITILSKKNSHTHLIQQVIDAVPPEELNELCTQVNLVRFIPGFDCRTRRDKIYTLQDVISLNEQRVLFLNSSMSKEIALELQKAIQEYTLVLVDRMFGEKFCTQLTECNQEACLSFLQQKPKLSDDKDRINLLKRLLQ